MMNKQGFTLLEMAIVLMLLSILMVGGLQLYSKADDKLRYDITMQRLEDIENALALYVRQYGALPAPANLTYDNINTDFGLGLPTTSLDTIRYPASSPTDNIIYGILPIRDLGLTYEHINDGWNRRFFYFTDSKVIASSSLSYDLNYEKFTNFINNITAIEIYDHNLGNSPIRLKDNIAYAVISTGENGNGGVSNKVGTRLGDSTTMSVYEKQNTQYGTPTGPVDEHIIYTGENYDDFDDIVIYKTRWQLTD